MKTERRKPKKPFLPRMTTLILLVSFVFVILLLSILIAIGISYVLMNVGILQPLSKQRFPVIFGFILLVNLFIGTVLAILGGDYLLKPIRELSKATREVAVGNYSIQIKPRGPGEVYRLGVSFNAMTRELASVETLRNDFINSISHEFKTPIVSIRGFAKRLKKGTLSDQEKDEYLDIIISETERLTSLAGSVILMSKLESTERQVEKAPFPLDEQLRKALLLLEPQFEKKGIRLEIDLASTLVTSNEELLHHVWINLLENAVKFSPQDASLFISLQNDGRNAMVCIRDQGIGMEDEVVKHIFDKFYQGDTSRLTAGSGLGLSLVKKILELCGGSITVESAHGKGSAFTVSLPMEVIRTESVAQA